MRLFGRSRKGNSRKFALTEVSEVQLGGAEHRSVTKVMSSSCSQSSPVKEQSSSMRNSTRDPSSVSCSETSLLERVMNLG